MKRFFICLALLAAIPAFAKDTVKLSFLQIANLIGGQDAKGNAIPGALVLLDGSICLDKDNQQVQIAYDLKFSTRISIARDIKILMDAEQAIRDSWIAYMKGNGITDETKLTPEQAAKRVEYFTKPVDVDGLYLIPEADLGSKDSHANPIPPTVLTRLLPLIKG